MNWWGVFFFCLMFSYIPIAVAVKTWRERGTGGGVEYRVDSSGFSP